MGDVSDDLDDLPDLLGLLGKIEHVLADVFHIIEDREHPLHGVIHHLAGRSGLFLALGRGGGEIFGGLGNPFDLLGDVLDDVAGLVDEFRLVLGPS